MDKPIAIVIPNDKVLDKEIIKSCTRDENNCRPTRFCCYDIHNTYAFITYSEGFTDPDENILITNTEVQDLLNPEPEELDYLEVLYGSDTVYIYSKTIELHKEYLNKD